MVLVYKILVYMVLVYKILVYMVLVYKILGARLFCQTNLGFYFLFF